VQIVFFNDIIYLAGFAGSNLKKSGILFIFITSFVVCYDKQKQIKMQNITHTHHKICIVHRLSVSVSDNKIRT